MVSLRIGGLELVTTDILPHDGIFVRVWNEAKRDHLILKMTPEQIQARLQGTMKDDQPVQSDEPMDDMAAEELEEIRGRLAEVLQEGQMATYLDGILRISNALTPEGLNKHNTA